MSIEHHESKYLGWGQKVIFFFSESGNVVYQIKVK